MALNDSRNYDLDESIPGEERTRARVICNGAYTSHDSHDFRHRRRTCDCGMLQGDMAMCKIRIMNLKH